MSRDDVRRFIVCYDVPNDARRGRLAKVLESHGDRVQYSVFIVDASPARMIRMTAELKTVMASEEDSVLLCDLGLKSRVGPDNFRYLGLRRTITDASTMIV